MDTVESSNQYVSGMTVKNSHRVAFYNNSKKGQVRGVQIIIKINGENKTG